MAISGCLRKKFRLDSFRLYSFRLDSFRLDSFRLDSFRLNLVRHDSFRNWRHPWYNGSALDCWPTGRATDPASGA